MMKLYSKDNIVAPLKAMAANERFVHSYILTGEKGVGKKVCARYIAMQLLCDNGNACGECRQCRRVLKGQHPDFIVVEKSGKSYPVSVVREKVVNDSFTVPNDCERKVYFLYDCDGWNDAAQNALLKVTEDPPDTAYFIFSAMSRDSFLTTLISRSMVIEVPEADKDSCMQALGDMEKYSEEQIADAVSCFGGNIGRCIDYLEGDKALKKAADTVRSAVEAIISKDEYKLAAVLNSVAGSRDEMRYTLEMLAKALRDSACAANGSSELLGCAPELSRRLGSRAVSGKLLKMYDAVCEASERCTQNCNAAAAAAVLAGKLCG